MIQLSTNTAWPVCCLCTLLHNVHMVCSCAQPTMSTLWHLIREYIFSRLTSRESKWVHYVHMKGMLSCRPRIWTGGNKTRCDVYIQTAICKLFHEPFYLHRQRDWSWAILPTQAEGLIMSYSTYTGRGTDHEPFYLHRQRDWSWTILPTLAEGLIMSHSTYTGRGTDHDPFYLHRQRDWSWPILPT